MERLSLIFSWGVFVGAMAVADIKTDNGMALSLLALGLSLITVALMAGAKK